MVFGNKAIAPPQAQRRRRLFLLIGILAGIAAAGLTYAVLSDAAASDTGSSGATATVKTVVARVDVAAGEEFKAGDLELRAIAEGDVHNLAFHDIDDLVGKAPAVPVYAGAQVIGPQLFEGPSGSTLAVITPDGMRAFSFAVEQSTVAGGLIVPGDRVDVLAVFPADSTTENPRPATVSTIVQNVEVIAVGQEVVQRDPGTSSEVQPDAQTITLAVSATDAQRIALADEVGTVRTIVRSGSGESRSTVPALTLDDLLN